MELPDTLQSKKIQFSYPTLNDKSNDHPGFACTTGGTMMRITPPWGQNPSDFPTRIFECGENKHKEADAFEALWNITNAINNKTELFSGIVENRIYKDKDQRFGAMAIRTNENRENKASTEAKEKEEQYNANFWEILCYYHAFLNYKEGIVYIPPSNAINTTHRNFVDSLFSPEDREKHAKFSKKHFANLIAEGEKNPTTNETSETSSRNGGPEKGKIYPDLILFDDISNYRVVDFKLFSPNELITGLGNPGMVRDGIVKQFAYEYIMKKVNPNANITVEWWLPHYVSKENKIDLFDLNLLDSIELMNNLSAYLENQN